MPPPHRHKHFQHCLVLTKKNHQGTRDGIIAFQTLCPLLKPLLANSWRGSERSGSIAGLGRQERWELGTGSHRGMNHTENAARGRALESKAGSDAAQQIKVCIPGQHAADKQGN